MLQRGSFVNLWQKPQEKNALIGLGAELDACISDMTSFWPKQPFETKKSADITLSIEELTSSMDTIAVMHSKSPETVASLLTNPHASEFWLENFDKQKILPFPEFLLGMQEFNLRHYGIERSDGLDQLMLQAIDSSEIGVISAVQLNQFFEEFWREDTIGQKIEAAASIQIGSHIFGNLCGASAKLTTFKVKLPSNFRNEQEFKLLPQGFDDRDALQDRHTRFGKDSDSMIKFHEEDNYCSKKQAILQHREAGYYLLETSLNGMTRIEVQPGTSIPLESGMVLSFGLTDTFVIAIYESGGRYDSIDHNGKTITNYFPGKCHSESQTISVSA